VWQSLYRVFGVIVLMTHLLATSVSAQTKLLRFPDVYEDRIVVCILDEDSASDGDRVHVPQFGTNAVDGDWVIEGIGVEPDIVVANDPKSVIAGLDPELERAVDEIMTMIRNDPRVLPERPAPPIKTP
jgi:hypothetical protein